MRRLTLVAGLALVAGLTTAGVGGVAGAAEVEVSPHCQVGGYCLFPGENFTGTRAVLPYGYGCRQVSDLGFPIARSAARGFGDGAALELYADDDCGTPVATVYYEVPVTAAASYRLIPIPG